MDLLDVEPIVALYIYKAFSGQFLLAFKGPCSQSSSSFHGHTPCSRAQVIIILVEVVL